MKNILYISPIVKEERTGGTLGREINQRIVTEYFAENFNSYSIKVHDLNCRKVFSTLLGLKCGLTNRHINKIIRMICQKKIEIIFIDTSLYGLLVRRIRKKYKDITIITFFHNCEYKIYSDSLKDKNRLIRYFILKSVINNEKKALIFSTVTIFLSNRDVDACKEHYHIVEITNKEYAPIALADEMIPEKYEKMKVTPHTLLFVGSSMFANVNGLLWFDRNVLPYIDYKLVIVGKGFEQRQFRDKLLSQDKIVTKGFVSNLNSDYKNADIVIQPVFEGSGMKTKTAECFMYGKTLVSSSEGFVGYDVDTIKDIYVCNTAKEFIDTLNDLKERQVYRFNQEIRDLFTEKYSIDSRKNVFFNLFRRFDN